MLQQILVQLGLEDYQTSKFTLSDVLNIGPESLQTIDLLTIRDVPWCFLRRLVALNVNARNIRPDLSQLEFTINGFSLENNLDMEERDDVSSSIHPLDVLCALLYCSDRFLQQEIVSKMSMCQFAVPLLLPAGDGPDCTFMLWAMRDIVKRWRPPSLVEIRGFKEDSLVHIAMPMISFVTLGKCSLSKSAILNMILTPSQQHHNYFIHRNMDGGNIPRKVSNGLVEMSWYFPAGQKNSDIFSEPVAITNLRGNLTSHWTQFSFLTQVSSAMFIFTESIDEQDYQILSNIGKENVHYFIILTHLSSTSKKTEEYIKKLYPLLKMTNNNFLVKKNTANDAELVRKLQHIIADLIKKTPSVMKLEDMATKACKLGIQVDEDAEDCQRAKLCAIEITKNIRDVRKYKKNNMKLQGELWKQLSDTGKELCRMRRQGNENGEDYRAKLIKKQEELLEAQSKHSLSTGMQLFIDAITKLTRVQTLYFLKWMKYFLDSVARNSLSKLQALYKQKCENSSANYREIKQLDENISESSLGIEHYIRELGQFYEAEFSNNTKKRERQFGKLPGIAANLLLDGFPLELIDGDASNIPLQWICDILKELEKKMSGQCRMRVITVLGVQSTGKSTLLNTMFGLQFPVASGRCTRGAFMTLVKVKDTFQEEMGCNFILVIDTEGLKAPELASLDHSYEHDNELATLVVGLSDITIVNMAMENTAEMKDILQIVVHAFLRMDNIGKKPTCHLVHQNVSDVAAYEKNLRDRKKMCEQLNEIILIAAKMEKKTDVKTFTDVMEHDLEKHSWYISGLWHGVPPMASVNSGYSDNIYDLKTSLLQSIKQLHATAQNISQFSEWLKSLWNAVKYESFIFSFRNSLVAEAYDQLSIKYSDLHWHIRKVMHNWIIETENVIKNQSTAKLQTETSARLKNDMNTVLDKEEKLMSAELKKYFDNRTKKDNLIERYREDFLRSVKLHRRQIEYDLLDKLEEIIRIQKDKDSIEELQKQYHKHIEEKVTILLRECRDKKVDLDDTKVQSEFEKMWNDTLSGLELRSLNKRNISQEILEQLRKSQQHNVGSVHEQLINVKNLMEYREKKICVEKKHFEKSKKPNMLMMLHNVLFFKDIQRNVNSLVYSLLDTCMCYVKDKVDTKVDYHDTQCQELLKMINERLNQEDFRKFQTTALFELEIKLHILGQAAPMFQNMHNVFIQENDSRLCLEEMKSQYYSIFENALRKKDECQNRAKSFCNTCLKPAIIEYIYKHLGREMVDDVLQSGDSIEYNSRTFFQFTLLKKLFEDKDFEQYQEYITDYERFVKRWILNYITDKYKKSGSENLLSKIVSVIKGKVIEVLKDSNGKTSNVSMFLDTFCEMLKKDLVISQNDMKVILFQNTANVQQFSSDIQSHLCDTIEDLKLKIKSMSFESILSKVTLKPQDELFKRVFGCGKQCPFCQVPCEAGAADHKDHFASVHRPQGLGSYRSIDTNILVHSLCSTDVVGNREFMNTDTEWKLHPYKDYRKYYPNWTIQPDPSIHASDYWKFIFNEFNEKFAVEYSAEPALFPEDWKVISEKQALDSLQESFNRK